MPRGYRIRAEENHRIGALSTACDAMLMAAKSGHAETADVGRALFQAQLRTAMVEVGLNPDRPRGSHHEPLPYYAAKAR